MLFVFVVALVVAALTCTVYVLNEKKYITTSELNNIKLIEQKLLEYKDSNSAGFELEKNSFLRAWALTSSTKH